MNGDGDFVRSLSEFLALHMDQSAGHLNYLIKSFLQGAVGRTGLEPSVKNEVINQLKAEIEAHNDVPSYLENYCSKLRNRTYGPLTLPQSHRDICAAGQAKGSSHGSGGNSSSRNSMGSRSAER